MTFKDFLDGVFLPILLCGTVVAMGWLGKSCETETACIRETRKPCSELVVRPPWEKE